MGGKRVHVSISMSDWIDKGEIMYIPGWNKWSPMCEICSRMKRDNLCTVIRKSAQLQFFMAGCQSGIKETCKHRWVISILVFQAHMASKRMNAFKCGLVQKVRVLSLASI